MGSTRWQMGAALWGNTTLAGGSNLVRSTTLAGGSTHWPAALGAASLGARFMLGDDRKIPI